MPMLIRLVFVATLAIAAWLAVVVVLVVPARLDILRTELVVAMKLLGAATVADLRRSHVAIEPAASSG
jgi:isopentenyl diphosphate isomerase/L-lactate dehydrogenase-like FMN-dependent dehydrogenase